MGLRLPVAAEVILLEKRPAYPATPCLHLFQLRTVDLRGGEGVFLLKIKIWSRRVVSIRRSPSRGGLAQFLGSVVAGTLRTPKSTVKVPPAAPPPPRATCCPAIGTRAQPP